MTAQAQRCCYIGCGKLYVPRPTGQRAAHLYCSRLVLLLRVLVEHINRAIEAERDHAHLGGDK